MSRPMNAVVLPDIPLTGSTTVNTARSARRSLWPRAARDEGATAVEFALIFPLVIAVCFFSLYGAMFFYYKAVADHVARTVARQVSIPIGETGSAYPDASCTSDKPCQALTTDAKSAAGSLIPDPSSASMTTTGGSATPEEGDLVTVTVTYNLPLLGDLASVIPGLSSIKTISGSASERRQ